MPNIFVKDFGISYYKKRNETLVFEHLNCSFANEKINAILGQSGSGKSTLLRAIAGLLSYAGDIYFDKQNINKVPPFKREIGYISQEYALYSHLNVFDNIAYPLKVLNADSQEIKERVLEVAKQCQLEDCLFVKPKYLSGGHQQRVAIARAIVNRVKILLLDEPFSNLDKEIGANLRHLVANLTKKYHITTLYVTHVLEEATSIADTFSYIDGDKVYYFDDSKSFLESGLVEKYGLQ